MTRAPEMALRDQIAAFEAERDLAWEMVGEVDGRMWALGGFDPVSTASSDVIPRAHFYITALRPPREARQMTPVCAVLERDETFPFIELYRVSGTTHPNLCVRCMKHVLRIGR